MLVIIYSFNLGRANNLTLKKCKQTAMVKKKSAKLEANTDSWNYGQIYINSQFFYQAWLPEASV